MRKMLINARDPELIRVAIISEQGTLEELDFESAEHASYKGNIYKGQVVRIEPSLQAAFVDFGGPRNGFLPLSEVSGRVLTEVRPQHGRKEPPLRDEALERGQEIIVQATREPMGTKGAALTTYIALPGRYLVYLPDGETGGISRKIDSPEERSKLNELVRTIRGRKEVGLIVRTAGLDRSKTELQKDFRYLEGLWKQIVHDYQARKGPGLIWREQGATIRAVRDYYTDDIEEIWVDNPEIHAEVLRFFELTMPRRAVARVKLYEGPMPLFKRYGIEEQIDKARSRRVELPSGGSIVIDPTEALVAIDVNSGKSRGEKGIEETAFRTNCEAAREIARQLRLRNLGGIIVIDFIDMRDRKKRNEVEQTLKDAVKPDKANITLGRIGRFGTLEMLRQRLRTAGPGTGTTVCPTCSGTGKTRTPQLAALEALREIRAVAAEARPGTLLTIPLAEQSALFLLNERRSEITRLEQERGLQIVLKPADISPDAPLEIDRRQLDQLPRNGAAKASAPQGPAKTAGGKPHEQQGGGRPGGRNHRQNRQEKPTQPRQAGPQSQGTPAQDKSTGDAAPANPGHKARRRGARGSRGRGRKRNSAAKPAEPAKNQ